MSMIGMVKSLLAWTAVAAVVLASAGTAGAQDLTCNSGDIAWVSSNVDANVGLAAGSGRCATSTVAGAAYNDISTPWGIQAVFDCACSGLIIRVLGNTGDYGAATNSWNNRFDATKAVRPQSISVAVPPKVIGYADASTSCENSNAPTGCPVMLDFAGGSSNGFTVAGQYGFWGVGVENANNDCFNSTSDNVTVAGGTFTGCGDDGVEMGGTTVTWLVRSWVHNNGNSAGDAGVRLTGSRGKYVEFNTIENNADIGIAMAGQQQFALHNIIYSNSGDGVQFTNRANTVGFNTIRDNGGDGIDSTTTTNSYAQTVWFNLITGSGGWGINQLSGTNTSNRFLAYNVLGGNTSGDINTASLRPVGVTYGNVTGATVVYASTSDHTPESGAELTLFYPRGTTEVTINAGAVSEGGGATAGGGGGGVFLPGGFR